MLELAPTYVDILNSRGNAPQSIGDLDSGLGRPEDAMGAYKDAVAAFDRALELAPDYAPAHSNRDIALQMMASLRNVDSIDKV